MKRGVGDAGEALEIARRGHLGDADAGGDAPLAEQVGVIAGRDLTPDAFGEAVEDDALHADRQQAELLAAQPRSEEHTSELQSLMRSSYAVFCLKKKHQPQQPHRPYS